MSANLACSLRDMLLQLLLRPFCKPFVIEFLSMCMNSCSDFWQYFEPEREHMPQNCSADVQVVMAHIDEVFSGENATAIQEIKELFGMGDMTHLDDVAGARM